MAKREKVDICYGRNRVAGNMLQLSSVTTSSMLRCVVLCPTIWAEHHFFKVDCHSHITKRTRYKDRG